jgi:hypothetical protein
MAQIKFYKNMFEEDFVLQEYDTSKTLLQQIEEFSTESAYIKDYVECYDSETGETFFEPLIQDSENPSVLITVNGVSVKDDYKVKNKDVITVVYLPLSDKQEGAGIGALVGGVVGGIIAIASGGVGALIALGVFTLFGTAVGMGIGNVFDKGSESKMNNEKKGIMNN